MFRDRNGEGVQNLCQFPCNHQSFDRNRKVTTRTNRNWSFSSENDPDLGPNPSRFGVRQILLCVFLAAIAFAAFVAGSEASNYNRVSIISIAVTAVLVWWNSPGFRLRATFTFAVGALIYARSTMSLVSILLSRDEGFGMLSFFPVLVATLSVIIAAVGVYLQFAALKWGDATSG